MTSKSSIINLGQEANLKRKKKRDLNSAITLFFLNLRCLFFNMRTRDMMQADTYKGIQLTAGGCEIMTVNLISEQVGPVLKSW